MFFNGKTIILPPNLTKSDHFGCKIDSFINKEGRIFKYQN